METNLEGLATSINTVWVSTATYLIFFMQGGFLLLGAGFVKMKNYSHLSLLILVNMCISGLAWYVTGYGFAFGNNENPLIGDSFFVGYGLAAGDQYTHYLFQWVFALDTVIASGCVCERITIRGYAILCILNGLWTYPVIVHWAWGDGWLEGYGYADFAGSGVVHLTGGTVGIVVCLILGARASRFDPKKKEEFLPSNPSFIAMGTIVLWFGWYGFNCGSTQSAIGANAEVISLVGLNTSLSAAAGGIAALVYSNLTHKEEDEGVSVPAICNGILAGTVAITAPCNNVEPWAAIIIGVVAAGIYFFVANLLIKNQIDDPVDAFPIHGGTGAWGVLSVGFFDQTTGLFYGGGFRQLGVQALGVAAIVVFAGVFTYLVMAVLQRLGSLRISLDEELKGSDDYLMHIYDHHVDEEGKPLRAKTGDNIQ